MIWGRLQNVQTKLMTSVLMLILFVFTSCVPKATEKTATCKQGEQFNTTKRMCEKILNPRYKPTGTLSSLSLSENSVQQVTLTYTDLNNDRAVSCKVTDTNSNIEVVSPETENAITEASNLISSEQIAVTAMSAGADKTNAQTALTNATAALTIAQTTRKKDDIHTQLDLVLSYVDTAITLSVVTQPTFTSSASSQKEIVEALVDSIENRCYCDGGVCKAMVGVKNHFIGTAGFSYTVNDGVDGDSSSRAVSITSSDTAEAPVASYQSSSFSESTIDFATYADGLSAGGAVPSYSVTIPTAYDADGNSLTYKLVTPPSHGTLTGCVTSSVANATISSLTCNYLPTNLDANGTAAVSASLVVQDITYTAKKAGAGGNNISIEYVQADYRYPFASSAEPYVKVSGDAITVYVHSGITTATQVEAAVDANTAAAMLVSTTISGTASDGQVVAASASLSGGTASYDSFTYKVSDGTSYSQTATVDINLTAQDDGPRHINNNSLYPLTLQYPVSTPLTILEDSGVNQISLVEDTDFYDPESDAFTACNASASAGLTVTCAITISGVTFDITPTANFVGTSSFTYTLTSGGKTSVSSGDIYVSVTAVNDEPVVKVDTVAVADGGTTAAKAGTEDVATTLTLNVKAAAASATDETSQTFTFTAVSSADTTVLPLANITFGTIDTNGDVTVTLTPAANQSNVGTFNIVLKVQDSGGTTNSGDDSVTFTVPVGFTEVDDAPVVTVGSIGSEDTGASDLTYDLNTVTINENGTAYIGPIYIDEGGGAGEDSQGVRIDSSSISSDNISLVDTSSDISFYYDLDDDQVLETSEQITLNSDFDPGGGTGDVSAHGIWVKIRPQQSTNGVSNIQFKALVNTTVPVYFNVPLSVRSIYAVHGKWQNAYAVGPKLDKNSEPIKDFYCNANTTGTGVPNGVVTATKKWEMYSDSASGDCYTNTAVGKNSWQLLKTLCPISISSSSTEANYIQTSAPTTEGSVGDYIYDKTNKKCWYKSSSSAGTIADYVEYTPTKVYLKWGTMTVSGSLPYNLVGISYYKVFRKLVDDSDYDYNHPLEFDTSVSPPAAKTTGTSLTSNLSSSISEIVDTTANAGYVYTYKVVPVDDTSTPRLIEPIARYSEINMVAPTANQSFIHRWVMNIEVCEKMHKTVKWDTTNYRFYCDYFGPGATSYGTGYIYDVGSSILVDQHEMGCPYDYIDDAAPTGTGSVGEYFYDRSTGNCYRSTGAAWTVANMISNTNTSTKAMASLLPPIVNVTAANAATICANRSAQTYSKGTTTMNSSVGAVPSRLVQIAISAERSDYTDSQNQVLEEGLSLNSTSRCNGSNADGLESYYSDSDLPPSSARFTLPGTLASSIRSLWTGSIGTTMSTESCTNRYGIQDLYGNVAEWTSDYISSCSSTDKKCSNSSFTLYATNEHNSTHAFLNPTVTYALDYNVGPCNDGNADAQCLAVDIDADTVADVVDSQLDEWDIRDEYYSSSRLLLPVGLPMTDQFVNTYSGLESSANVNYFILDDLLDIGSTAGLTHANLREDAFIFNTDAIASGTGKGFMATGGSYLSGNRAGRWTMETLEETTTREDIGFRCYSTINP